MATDISALFPGITTSASPVDNDPDFYFRKMAENLNKLTPLTGDELERVLNEDDSDMDGIPEAIHMNIKQTGTNLWHIIKGSQIRDAFEEAGLVDEVPKAFAGDIDALDACIEVFLSHEDPAGEFLSSIGDGLRGSYIDDIAAQASLSADQAEKLQQHTQRFEEQITKFMSRALYAPIFDQQCKADCDARFNQIIKDGVNYAIRGFGPPPMPES